MREIFIRSIMDEELKCLAPHQTQKEYKKLVARGLYGQLLEDLIRSDVKGLVNPLANLLQKKGVSERQLPHALVAIREIKRENVEDARKVINASIQRILALGSGFEWQPPPIIRES